MKAFVIVLAVQLVSGFNPRSAARVGRLSSRRLGSTAASIDVLGDGGVVKKLNRQGSGEPLTEGSVAVVRYRGTVGGKVFTASEMQSITVGDGRMIPGTLSAPI
jgi:hypothetical protein